MNVRRPTDDRAAVSRRRMLRAAGVTLALPWLGRRLAAEEKQPASGDGPPRRLLLISNNLGVLPEPFFPRQTGENYELSPYLQELAEFKADFTVFSGLSHPGVVGGHSTENCFLTGARGPTKSGFRNQISLDQFVAEQRGHATRFPTLNLGVNIDKANRSLAWTRDGVLLPAEDRPSALFQKMFLQGDDAAVQSQLERLRRRGSILDALAEPSRRLRRDLGPDDRRRLDQYFDSVREVENRLAAARDWEQRPKPKTDRPPPVDVPDPKRFFDKFDLMLSTALLALESDSTRIVTLMVDAFATPVFQLDAQSSTTDGYHNLSHHGRAPDKLRQLETADRRQMALLHKLLADLAARRDGERRLLDDTLVLFGSNMGDSNTHDNSNLPILLAGGRFRHGRHLAQHHDHNAPLCNLFVSMLQQMGLECDRFGTSTGTLAGLPLTARGA